MSYLNRFGTVAFDDNVMRRLIIIGEPVMTLDGEMRACRCVHGDVVSFAMWLGIVPEKYRAMASRHIDRVTREWLRNAATPDVLKQMIEAVQLGILLELSREEPRKESPRYESVLTFGKTEES